MLGWVLVGVFWSLVFVLKWVLGWPEEAEG